MRTEVGEEGQDGQRETKTTIIQSSSLTSSVLSLQ